MKAVALLSEIETDGRAEHSSAQRRRARTNDRVVPTALLRRDHTTHFVVRYRIHTPAARRSAFATSSAPSRTALPRSTKISLSAPAA